jgi:hypothetical protein
MVSEHTCPKCGVLKPASEFHKNKNTKTGLQVYCIPCYRKINRDWYERKGQEKKHKYREYSAKRRIELYGISVEEFAELHQKQNGRCAICQQEETALHLGKKKRLAIDHDHKTGKVRALLCADCNRAIGMMGDDPARLRAAAEYILRYQD